MQHIDVWKLLRMDHRPVRERVGKRERAEELCLGRARVEDKIREKGNGKTVKHFPQ